MIIKLSQEDKLGGGIQFARYLILKSSHLNGHRLLKATHFLIQNYFRFELVLSLFNPFSTFGEWEFEWLGFQKHDKSMLFLWTHIR